MTCGTGNWNGPAPGDPDNVITLSAVATYGAIVISWNYPATRPYAVAHFKLFRATLNDYLQSQEIAIINGNTYRDTVQDGIQYYYWLQVITVNGTVAEAVGPAFATALPEIDKMIAILTGQIDAGLLAQTLRNEIDAIPINRAAFDQEVLDRIEGDDVLSISVAAAQGAANNAVALIAQETNTRTSEVSSLAQQITTVGAALGDDIALVEQTMQAGIDANTGTINSMYTVRLTANNIVGGFGLMAGGNEVEAGFDVDKFWVGRTGPDKKKPFIISGGVVWLDNAVIANASINLAHINTATITNLAAIKADMGDLTAGTITLNSNNAGSWSFMRSRAAKWWYDGVTGLIFAGYSPTNSFFLDVTAGQSTIRMSSGASVGETSYINFGNGKFIADSNGDVTADTCKIRRRIVAETGQANPSDMVLYTGDDTMAWDAFNGIWVQTWDYGGAQTTYCREVKMLVLTNQYDTTAWDINGSNQPWYVVAMPNGAFRSWIGNASDYYVIFTARAVPVRAYSNVGQYANDYRIGIVFHYYIKLIAGTFTQFQLPLIDWTLYKL